MYTVERVGLICYISESSLYDVVNDGNKKIRNDTVVYPGIYLDAL